MSRIGGLTGIKLIFSDCGENGVSSRCEIPPTVAVRPNNISARPVVESLASQLQRQKISAEGASGYSKFKSDFQGGSKIKKISLFRFETKRLISCKKLNSLTFLECQQTNVRKAQQGFLVLKTPIRPSKARN